MPAVVASTMGLIQSHDAYLRNRRTLLILDSCEHVIEQVALVAERLFQGGPQTYILATSREALRADGERMPTLPPLNCPPSDSELTAEQVLSFPAAQLLVERVVASGYPLTLDGMQSPLVAEICRALDGIPLAIELAAGSVSAFGLRETAARLNSGIELLWQGRRTAPSRHQTLSATLDWSYHLLSDGERTVLRRLSAFAGHFFLEAARRVASGAHANEDQVVTALAGLLAKSLVAIDASGPATTYRLLDTTRIYALGRLIDSGDAELTSLRHAVYFLGFLETTAAGPPSPRDGKGFKFRNPSRQRSCRPGLELSQAGEHGGGCPAGCGFGASVHGDVPVNGMPPLGGARDRLARCNDPRDPAGDGAAGGLWFRGHASGGKQQTIGRRVEIGAWCLRRNSDICNISSACCPVSIFIIPGLDSFARRSNMRSAASLLPGKSPTPWRSPKRTRSWELHVSLKEIVSAPAVISRPR